MKKNLLHNIAHRLAVQYTPDDEALPVLLALADKKMTMESVAELWGLAKDAALAKLKGVTDSIQKYISETKRVVSVTEWVKMRLDETSETSETSETERDRAKLRNTARRAFNRFKEAGVLRAMDKPGWYEKIDTKLEILDWKKADLEVEPLILPFALSTLMEFHPGNIILVAGARNAGKTAFLLNVIADNMHRYDVHLFNSESGASELKKRLLKFDDMPVNEWRFEAYARSGDFGSVIKPGRGMLNIVDYLEVYKDFWIVGKWIQEIWEALHGALAIVALQKPLGRDFGIGGEISLDKPRLAVAMDRGTIKIVKAKAWKGDFNPNGMSIGFTIIDGCKLKPMDNWGEKF